MRVSHDNGTLDLLMLWDAPHQQGWPTILSSNWSPRIMAYNHVVYSTEQRDQDKMQKKMT